MEDIKELYILGKPIETPLGLIYFIKVKDFDLYIEYMPYLQLQKYEVLNKIRQLSVEIADEIKDVPFIEIIKQTKNVFELYQTYREMFLLFFRADVFDQIETDEEFNKYISLIMRMNAIQKEEKNVNPEIDRWNQYSKMYQKMKSNGETSFESIFTSVEVYTGRDPSEMTLYRMYADFNRIAQFKEHDMTVLYRSVSDEVKITPWYNHIEIGKEADKQLTSLEKLLLSQKEIM